MVSCRACGKDISASARICHWCGSEDPLTDDYKLPSAVWYPKGAAQFRQKQWLYERFRVRVEYEVTLIAHRVAWLLAGEAFFFTAYANLLGQRANIDTFSSQARALFNLLPVLGFGVALAVWCAIVAANSAVNKQRNAAKLVFPSDDEFFSQDLLSVQTGRFARFLGRIPARLLPLFFMGTWVFLFFNGR